MLGQGAYGTLKRVFEEHYQAVPAEGEKKTAAAPLDTEKAGAKSVESPYGGGHGERAEHGEDTEEQAEAREQGEMEDTEDGEAVKNAEAGEQAETVPRETKEIDAKSVQSPHGPDCHYRNKNGKGVKGSSVNVTETCDSGKLNLIVDVQTEPASMADNHYLPSAGGCGWGNSA